MEYKVMTMRIMIFVLLIVIIGGCSVTSSEQEETGPVELTFDVEYDYTTDDEGLYEETLDDEVTYHVTWIRDRQQFEIKSEETFLHEILSPYDVPEGEPGVYQLISEEALYYLARNDDFRVYYYSFGYNIIFSHSNNSGEKLMDYIKTHAE